MNDFSFQIKRKTYLCKCKFVSEEAILQKILEGATTVEEISLTTHAATGCGQCKKSIEKLLEQHEHQH